MTHVLLLDYNGVIVDDEPLHFATFAQVLREEGIALDAPTYAAEYLGFDDRAAFREAWRRADRPLEPAHLRDLVRRKARAYAAREADELRIVPGVAEFVTAARGAMRLAVVSGALREEITRGLARARITDSIEVVISAEDVPAAKPDPAGFRQAVRALSGGRPARAVVIEDSLPGLAGARALGAGCVMLSTSHDTAALRGADAVWTDFTGRAPDDLAPHWREVTA